MPYLELRNETYRLVHRHGGKKLSRSLQTKDKEKAELRLAQFKDSLSRLKLGLLELAPGDDIFATLLSGGRTRQASLIKTEASLGSLLDQYLASVPADAIEDATRKMLQTHVGHLKRIMGIRRPVRQIDLSRIQSYINARSEEPGTALPNRKVDSCSQIVAVEMVAFRF